MQKVIKDISVEKEDMQKRVDVLQQRINKINAQLIMDQIWSFYRKGFITFHDEQNARKKLSLFGIVWEEGLLSLNHVEEIALLALQRLQIKKTHDDVWSEIYQAADIYHDSPHEVKKELIKSVMVVYKVYAIAQGCVTESTELAKLRDENEMFRKQHQELQIQNNGLSLFCGFKSPDQGC
jgi:hypothetical protein